jgi:hypothetical protein
MARWLLLLLTGCSLTLSGPDPNRPRTKAPTCDTSKSLVAVDGVLTATMSIVALAAAGNDNESAAVAPALLAAAFLGSAIHGNNVVNACQRDMESYDEALAAQETLGAPRPQPAYQPPPQSQAEPGPQLAAQLQPQPPTQLHAPPPAQPRPQAPSESQPPPPDQSRPAGDRWSAFWREVP